MGKEWPASGIGTEQCKRQQRACHTIPTTTPLRPLVQMPQQWSSFLAYANKCGSTSIVCHCVAVIILQLQYVGFLIYVAVLLQHFRTYDLFDQRTKKFVHLGFSIYESQEDGNFRQIVAHIARTYVIFSSDEAR